MQDSDNDYLIVALKVKDAVVFAIEIPVFRMNRNQRIQRADPASETFRETERLFSGWR